MKKNNKKKTLSVKDIRKQQLKAKKAKQKELTARNKTKFVYKKGSINQQALEKLYEAKGVKKIGTKIDIEEYAKDYVKLHKTGKLTVERLWASYTGDHLSGMLVNTGFTLDQLAGMTNSTPEELTDESNWSDDWTIFTNSNGEQYQFEFSYSAETVFVKL